MSDLPNAAMHRLERFLERDHAGIGEAGRTILLRHGERRPRTVVLFHGLSASPAQFVRFASDLHARGHNVLVPRLPRHGYRNRLSAALAGLTRESLERTARESIALAYDLGERVTVAGFSLGGLLAVWSAQHEEIERAVAIAPFLGVAWIPNRWMFPLMELALRIPNRFAWWDPIAREKQLPEHGYPRFATHALAQSYRLASQVMRDATAAPVRAHGLTLVINQSEAAVNNRAMRRLAEMLSRHADGRIHSVALSGLPFSHDIIEPLRHPELAQRVYPRLLELIDPS
ncbi:MAG: alpha/beta hydrolase [Vulcanimicrobiaceae bacterium]